MAPAPFPGAANGTPFTYPTMTAYGAPHGGVQQAAPQVGVAPGVYGNTNQAGQGGQKANGGVATASGGPGRPDGTTMGEANGNGGHHAMQAGGEGVVTVNGINGMNGVNGAANLWASQSRGAVGVGGGQQQQQQQMSAGANNNNGAGKGPIVLQSTPTAHSTVSFMPACELPTCYASPRPNSPSRVSHPPPSSTHPPIHPSMSVCPVVYTRDERKPPQ